LNTGFRETSISFGNDFEVRWS